MVVALGACAEPPPPALKFTSNPIAVGAIAHGHLEDLGTASIEPPDQFLLTIDGDDVEVVAMTPGMGTLHVETRDGFAINRILDVRAIDRISAIPVLRDEACVDALYTLGTRASVATTLYAGDTKLNGDLAPPIAASAGTIDTDSSADGTIEVRLPDTAGTVRLTSMVDPELDVSLEVTAPSAVDALVLGEQEGRLFPTSVTTVSVDVLAGERTLCGDTLSRTVVVETPDTCKLDGGDVQRTEPGLGELRIRGYHAGACTVRVTVEGTGLAATKTLAVSM